MKSWQPGVLLSDGSAARRPHTAVSADTAALNGDARPTIPKVLLRTAASRVSGPLDRQKRDRAWRKRYGSRGGRGPRDRRKIAAVVDVERCPVQFDVAAPEGLGRQRVALAFERHLDGGFGSRIIDDKKRHAPRRAAQAMGVDVPPLRALAP